MIIKKYLIIINTFDIIQIANEYSEVFMNKFLFTVALLAASVATFAQNRLVNKAEYAIKENKLDEAQTLLTEALNF